MKARRVLTLLVALCVCATAVAEEHDYYKHLRYPSKLVPGVGVDKVEQEGGPSAVGYNRRTVQWWPRKGHDFVDVPEGAPLRTWTRNKGQDDKSLLAGPARNWTASDPEKFDAHLIAFRGFGTSSAATPAIPAAVLRLENGRQRAVVHFAPVSQMVSREDREFIHKTWEEAFPKLYAKISKEERPIGAKFPLKHWKELPVRFNAMPPGKDANEKFPIWGEKDGHLIFETRNFHLSTTVRDGSGPPAWVRPNDIEGQNRFRRDIFEYIENFWTYVEAAGHSMPYWHWPGENRKYHIIVTHGGSGVGTYHCGIGNANTVALAHEFFHSQPLGGWRPFHYIMGNAGQHTGHPGELQMFTGNFRYPWRYINRMGYQSPMMFFVLGDNPNWGYGIQVVIGGLGGEIEPTPYHTIAMVGQKKGLWKNGVKGFGDFLGEYAARMATCDLIEQFMIRCKYAMPEPSYLYPVYGHENRYRISNAEAPRWTGYNIIRLDVEEGATEIEVDFQGIHDPQLHSDWRACIVAADGDGWARYSPLWNKGKMVFKLKPEDKNLWLTVSASPSAFPMQEPHDPQIFWHGYFLAGVHAPRYPWEVTLTGCKPGTPHRKHGDIVNFEELYPKIDVGNTYLNYPVKHEVPIPLTEKNGKLSQEKLAAMAPRVEVASEALQAKIKAGKAGGYYANKQVMGLDALGRRLKFLQENAKGHRHANGGGFVSDNAKVAETAYVGPDAMVLDGATVKDNACIKEFAVVFGPKTVVSGNAKIGGRAWVTGDLQVSGDARILEATTVTTDYRETFGRGRLHQGQAKIKGTAVIKGELFLLLSFATDQTLTGGLVVDYVADVRNGAGGVFKHGRYYKAQDRYDRAPGFGSGADAGALFANYQFNQPKAVLLEDYFVNNNGILHGRPTFTVDGERKCIVFNGSNQYAEVPPTVADFSALTIDMSIKRSGGGTLFDFGTGDDECFYLTVDGGGKPTLTAKHGGKTHTLVAAQGLPAGKWSQLRVEMDGSTASIHLDGKQIAKKGFAFSPREVFIGDRAEGNFIASDRSKGKFFGGSMDYFRVYRKVHEDFSSVGAPPEALIQVPEWSEEDQQRHDDWQKRRRAKEDELRAGKYGELHAQVRKISQEKDTKAVSREALIGKLRKEAEKLRETELKAAGLFGRNPYPGKNVADQHKFHRSLKYHTSADWDYKTQAENLDEIPPDAKKWLRDVRGY